MKLPNEWLNLSVQLVTVLAGARPAPRWCRASVLCFRYKGT